VAASAAEDHNRLWLWALLGGSLLAIALLGALGWRRRRRTSSAAAG
jgi:hypothetical protein